MTGKSIDVRGTSWMDHEFFTHSMDAEQVGWDWLSVQLEDNTELMLYQFRRKDGSTDPFTLGNICGCAEGNAVHLAGGGISGCIWLERSGRAASPGRSTLWRG